MEAATHRPPDLILGSASHRRRRILQSLGIPFRVVVPDVEEVTYPDQPRRTASENALLKHAFLRSAYPEPTLITADTVVVFDGSVIGKPVSKRQAHEFLRMFAGKSQSVVTAVAFSLPGCRPDVEVVVSKVVFRALSDDMIAEYFSHVDPMDKAGAYDIDHRGDMIIESFAGSRSNIMGLPAETVTAWLATHGYALKQVSFQTGASGIVVRGTA